MDSKIKTIIKEAIQTTGHHPFLFVDSGLSKRYLGSEKWDELLRKFCTEFSSNEFQYDVYANMVDEKDYYDSSQLLHIYWKRIITIKFLQQINI